MSILTRMLGLERRDSSLENPSTELVQAMTGGDELGTATGITITPEKALRNGAVFACVRVIAEGIGQLPLPVYERNGRSRDRVPDDPRWWFLNDEPNEEMSAIELHEMTLGHANLWGRGLQFIARDRNGAVTGLWPLRPEPHRTREFRLESGKLAYLVTLDNGEQRALFADEVICVKGFMGLSPIAYARESISLGLAAEEYGGRFYGNDGRPGGVIQARGDMNPQQVREFRQSWDASHRGLKRSHLVGILTGGAEWKDVGVPPNEAQFLETRQFQVQEIARWFRVPASMIEADKGGSLQYSTTEMDAIHLVVHTYGPWLARYEQAIKRRLFGLKTDRQTGRYPEFLVDALLRGDTLTRYQAYEIGIRSGWMNRADAREKENMIFADGLDEFLIPAGMIPAGTTLEDLRGLFTPADLARMAAAPLPEVVKQNGATAHD